jgi:hypothetical protein
MAYMNQERKAARAGKIKEICKRFGVKASLSIRNHSTLVLTVNSSQLCSAAPRTLALPTCGKVD